MTKIIIADDHDITLHGLVNIAEKIEGIDVVGKAQTGIEVLEILKTTAADIILSDVDMPDMDGLALLKIINSKHPHIKVLACTMHINSWTLNKLINNNVAGIISKHSVLNDIEIAIERVKNNELFYSEDVKNIIAGLFSKKQPTHSKYDEIHLTKREKQILSFIAKEYTSAQIAAQLNISDSTIESHRRNLFLKFDVKNSVGLIRKAMERGMI